MFLYIPCIIAFVIGMVLVRIMIPKILQIAFIKNLFDVPDDRKVHTQLVPRIGGFSFAPVIFFTMSFVLGWCNQFSDKFPSLAIDTPLFSITNIASSVLLIYLIGVADDILGVRYRTKFVVQILCAFLLVSSHLWFTDLHGLLFVDQVNAVWGWALAVFAIVFIVNAINLIDGVDGLASGLCIVALLYYGIIFYLMGSVAYSVLAFATLGVTVQFFYFNVFGNAEKRKKIFMGDTGSLTLGLIITFLSLTLVHNEEEFRNIPLLSDTNLFVVSFAPLIIPCFDVVRVFLGRVRRGKSPFLPDKTHIHHKLLDVGMGFHTTMVHIVCVSCCCTLLNVWLSQYWSPTLLLGVDASIYTLSNILLTRRIKRIKSTAPSHLAQPK